MLYTECKRQALLGVGYVGIIDLPKEQTPPIGLLAQWIHDVEKIRKRNDLFNCCCEIVYKELQHDGLWSCILKGQANLILYPENLLEYRTPGDIDVWAWPIHGPIQIAEGTACDGAHYEEYKGLEAGMENNCR